jgi:hypothetical protein
MVIETESFTEIIGVIGVLAGFIACYYLYKTKSLTKGLLSFAMLLIGIGIILISLSAALCICGVITNSEGGIITLMEDILKFLGLVLISYGGFKLYTGFREISLKQGDKK